MALGSRRNAGIILASASPRRREILANIGLHPLVDPSTAPEPARRAGESAGSYTIRVAKLKARDVSTRHRSGLIIGADTIVLIDNQILGKPFSEEEARKMLRTLGGRWHEVITGICLIDSSSQRSCSAHSRSRVHLRRLSSDEIEWYLTTGEYCDKAGGYAIQGLASLFVDRIEGCYFNIVGFPITCFLNACRKMGFDLLRQIQNPEYRTEAGTS